MYSPSKKYIKFLKSSLTEENPFIATNEVKQWVKRQMDKTNVDIRFTSFDNLEKWHLDMSDGVLRHESNRFFSVIGIQVQTNFGEIDEWQQPIILQPEIGYLGFITKEFNGILYFLVQAKIEPGNINTVQLSPTLQATKSNYTRAHRGKVPDYYEYFADRDKSEVLLDQLQSEQGARFLKKRNRNIIIETKEDIEVKSNFIWLTLGQLKKLLSMDNIVNMDTRTVISGISFGSLSIRSGEYLSVIKDPLKRDSFSGLLPSALSSDDGINTLDDIIAWFTNLKSQYELHIRQIPLNQISEWSIGESEISRPDKKFFSVIGTSITIDSREVSKWMQPMVKPAQDGLNVFIIRRINGVYHFLVQAKVECGNFDIIEMAPTVQCITGNYRNTEEGSLPYLGYALSAPKSQIIFDTMQSEEGGRFYREQNRNMIIVADKKFPSEIPENYCWMTLYQLLNFIKFNNYLNIQARNLIAAISFSGEDYE